MLFLIHPIQVPITTRLFPLLEFISSLGTLVFFGSAQYFRIVRRSRRRRAKSAGRSGCARQWRRGRKEGEDVLEVDEVVACRGCRGYVEGGDVACGGCGYMCGQGSEEDEDEDEKEDLHSLSPSSTSRSHGVGALLCRQRRRLRRHPRDGIADDRDAICVWLHVIARAPLRRPNTIWTQYTVRLPWRTGAMAARGWDIRQTHDVSSLLASSSSRIPSAVDSSKLRSPASIQVHLPPPAVTASVDTSSQNTILTTPAHGALQHILHHHCCTLEKRVGIVFRLCRIGEAKYPLPLPTRQPRSPLSEGRCAPSETLVRRYT
ncbi:hypothetical protein R3P38DRAFT_3616605 [Favolaschia claudopus]|uniref:Uncharacterized protein n=1 Tax=Favolaschia claudopus TaxID=2862362 RepID=A0AAW0A403_9AGAR